MGIWGPGIFDNDAACDVQDSFEVELSAGASVVDATKSIIVLSAPDKNPIYGEEIYLALAALQLEHGTLEPYIKEKVLQIISDRKERTRTRAEYSMSDHIRKYIEVLEELQDRINTNC